MSTTVAKAIKSLVVVGVVFILTGFQGVQVMSDAYIEPTISPIVADYSSEAIDETLCHRVSPPKTIIPEDPNAIIYSYISDVCKLYPNIGQALVKSIIFHESTYDPNQTTGNCVGLMQVSTKWHKDRARKLGVTDFYDPYSNILLGVDYLSELLNQYKDITLVLMLYNMNHDDAIALSRSGKISGYARSVLAKAEEYEKGE